MVSFTGGGMAVDNITTELNDSGQLQIKNPFNSGLKIIESEEQVNSTANGIYKTITFNSDFKGVIILDWIFNTSGTAMNVVKINKNTTILNISNWLLLTSWYQNTENTMKVYNDKILYQQALNDDDEGKTGVLISGLDFEKDDVLTIQNDTSETGGNLKKLRVILLNMENSISDITIS